MGRFIVLVLDGFGVGYMDDVLEVRKRDFGANTAVHILEEVKESKWPTLEKLGLMNILDYETKNMKKVSSCVIGKSKLQHHGGDTFLGHQEIMGTKTEKPLIKPFSYYIDEVENKLIENGYTVERKGENVKYLWVNDKVAIGDNLETDLGQVYNVTTSFKEISFEDEIKIAQIVRDIVKVERVIVFGGTRATKESIFAAAREKEGKYMGIDAPLSLVYEEGYMVRHMGYGVDPKTQIPHLLAKNGIDVTLIGKVADIVYNEKGKSFINLVDTKTILELTLEEIKKSDKGYFCINVQETDLSGHAQNAKRYSDILTISDGYIQKILDVLNDDDILVVTADHGNDPTIGHSQHTRENTPLMIYSKKHKNNTVKQIGHRETMSDTAATALEYFNVENTLEQGVSYLKEIKK
ncbi:phosphopentomutase [Streptobacillus felis]|uniref:phosphopentomutase n=1 Tax=Streptobacillus felis TaxID=1384509 RepID=UPI0008362006|nr:phosphopentomutase [Streptobacillus felis]